MKWKTFWKIALLIIIAGIVAYMCVPKYKYDLRGVYGFRVNKYTGAMEKYDRTQEKWIRIRDKKKRGEI
ncbi:hypothetical protein ACFL2G_03860 [Candidatus Omnitrophota bacterium]